MLLGKKINCSHANTDVEYLVWFVVIIYENNDYKTHKIENMVIDHLTEILYHI